MTRQTISTWILTLAGLTLGTVGASTQAAQSTGEVPRFEAVSVKPCDPNADAGGARGGARPSPNRIFIPCLPARGIIRLAFLPGQNPRDRDRLVGGPGWLDSERFTIEAVADPSVPRAMLSGPMFQAVLVERFGLKVRREARGVRAYTLTPSPRGIRVTPLSEADCVQSQSPRPPRPRKPDCDLVTRASTETPLTLSRLLERSGQVWIDTRGNDRVFTRCRSPWTPLRSFSIRSWIGP